MTSSLDSASAPHVAASAPKASARRVVPLPKTGQYILAAAATLFAATLVVGLARNQYIEWSVVGAYLFNELVLLGLVATIELSVGSLLLGIVVGVPVAFARISKNPVLSQLAGAYVWLLRGIPAIVQLLIWGNIGLFLPETRIGIPFTDITFFSVKLNTFMTPFLAAILGLGLHESAFMAEILRGGLTSVESGQSEAAGALGMTRGRTMRRIIFPQALRVIIPPVGNQFVSLVKASALVSVIAGGELLTNVQNIGASNYRVIELLFVATFWYLVVLAIVSLAQGRIENALRRSER